MIEYARGLLIKLESAGCKWERKAGENEMREDAGVLFRSFQLQDNNFHFNSPTILTSANHLRAAIAEVLVKSNRNCVCVCVRVCVRVCVVVGAMELRVQLQTFWFCK